MSEGSTIVVTLIVAVVVGIAAWYVLRRLK